MIDPEQFDLENEDGELITGHDHPGGTTGEGSKSGGGRGGSHVGGQGCGLKVPDRSDPKKQTSASGRGVKNGTADEREEIGVRLVRRILFGDEKDVVDIRHQHNASADAIDDLDNFYELKVFKGKIPDDISLTS